MKNNSNRKFLPRIFFFSNIFFTRKYTSFKRGKIESIRQYGEKDAFRVKNLCEKH